jgi:hypothetical protein
MSNEAIFTAVAGETWKAARFSPWSISTPAVTKPAYDRIDVIEAFVAGPLVIFTTFLIFTLVPALRTGKFVSVNVEGAVIVHTMLLPRFKTK